MKTRYAGGAIACALGALLVAGGSAAQTVTGPLDQVGAACIPDAQTIREGLYETRGFGVGFRGESVGSIRLICPFVVSARGAKLGLTFMGVIDGDGIADGARVQAVLRHARLGSNQSETINVCDSNTSTLTGPQNVRCDFYTHVLKVNHSYWWDVRIERSNPRVNVELLMIGIRYAS